MPEIVQEIGAYAGLASVVGLAILSALYFSQARDVKRLREWAGRAPERGPAPPPQRVVAQPQRPGQPAAQQPGVPGQPRPGAPAVPGQPRPGVPALPGAQRPAAAAATGARPATAAGPKPATAAGAVQGAPAKGQAAATGGVQDPPKPPSNEPQPAQPVAEAKKAEAGPGQGPSTPAAQNAAASGAPQQTAAGAEPQNAATGAPQGNAAAGAPPSAPGRPDVDDAAPDATIVGGAPVSNGPASAPPAPSRPATPAAQRPAAAPPGRTSGPPPGARPRPPVTPRPAGGQRPPGRPLGDQTTVAPPPHEPWYRSPLSVVLLIVGAVIVIGGAAYALTSGGGDDGTTGSNGASQNSGQDPNDTPARARPAPVDPASVTVAVLNGTTVPGLARQVGDRVTAKGFQVGNVDDAPDSDQQRAESVVQFAQGHRREAMAVGSKLGISQREPIDVDVQQLAGDATVVVITGQDQSGQ